MEKLRIGIDKGRLIGVMKHVKSFTELYVMEGKNVSDVTNDSHLNSYLLFPGGQMATFITINKACLKGIGLYFKHLTMRYLISC